MKLAKISITNYRGIESEAIIDLRDFTCIVGQNDAGKSTILKALDCTLNDKNPSYEDWNYKTTERFISIELFFSPNNIKVLLGEEIETTLENEEVIDENGYLRYKKIWEVKDSSLGKPKTFLLRKIYVNDDILPCTENELIKLCSKHTIPTKKGNGDEFNNVEKRQKLREKWEQLNISYEYSFEEIPTSGTKKIKFIGDSIKNILPTFEYFKADTSLSETDSSIQTYFKKIAVDIINNKVNTDEVENAVIDHLKSILTKITDKINAAVPKSERIEPKVEFDWTKLVSTSFRSTSSELDIPLSSRGDGFRRITMMSYFEYLAESQKSDNRNIIFGFEEPETFLHPKSQENLISKIRNLVEKSYQVVLCTHSPTIVSKVKVDEILHVTKENNQCKINARTAYKDIADDLGISAENSFVSLFNNYNIIFMVEGVDDIVALKHIAKLYKDNGLINEDFDELKVIILPIGGCGQIKHWMNLDLFTQLGKPYYLFFDSDKDDEQSNSNTYDLFIKYGVSPSNFLITKKRLLENYIPVSALKRIIPELDEVHLQYGDFGHAKNMCKNYPHDKIRGKIGGGNVAETHFTNLTFEDIQSTWSNGTEDEFVNLYNNIKILA